jgi:NAD(P)H-dependent FMN reductase
MRIEIIAGTNRPGSNTLKLARLLEQLYQKHGVDAGVIDLQDLPAELFTGAAYGEKPAAFHPICQRVTAANGLHVVTPEYNGSFPGVLKYFIDMLKFPESFEHRCVAFTGLAAGVWGGIRAVEQIELVFQYRNAYLLPERVWFPMFHKEWDEAAGRLQDERKMGYLEDQVAKFVAFTGRNGDEAWGVAGKS